MAEQLLQDSTDSGDKDNAHIAALTLSQAYLETP